MKRKITGKIRISTNFSGIYVEMRNLLLLTKLNYK